MPPLSSNRIVTTARDLADREGLDAVTLRRLAAELGVHVTSLYNHVPTRDAIVDGIVELLIAGGGPARAPAELGGVGARVRRRRRRTCRRSSREPSLRSSADRCRASARFRRSRSRLAAFARAGLSPADAYSAIKATTHVALAIGVERALAARGSTAETEIDTLPADRFPDLRALPGRGRSRGSLGVQRRDPRRGPADSSTR